MMNEGGRNRLAPDVAHNVGNNVDNTRCNTRCNNFATRVANSRCQHTWPDNSADQPQGAADRAAFLRSFYVRSTTNADKFDCNVKTRTGSIVPTDFDQKRLSSTVLACIPAIRQWPASTTTEPPGALR